MDPASDFRRPTFHAHAHARTSTTFQPPIEKNVCVQQSNNNVSKSLFLSTIESKTMSIPTASANTIPPGKTIFVARLWSFRTIQIVWNIRQYSFIHGNAVYNWIISSKSVVCNAIVWPKMDYILHMRINTKTQWRYRNNSTKTYHCFVCAMSVYGCAWPFGHLVLVVVSRSAAYLTIRWTAQKIATSRYRADVCVPIYSMPVENEACFFVSGISCIRGIRQSVV